MSCRHSSATSAVSHESVASHRHMKAQFVTTEPHSWIQEEGQKDVAVCHAGNLPQQIHTLRCTVGRVLSSRKRKSFVAWEIPSDHQPKRSINARSQSDIEGIFLYAQCFAFSPHRIAAKPRASYTDSYLIYEDVFGFCSSRSKDRLQSHFLSSRYAPVVCNAVVGRYLF